MLSSNDLISLTQNLQHNIPDNLKNIFNKIQLEHYDELYEIEADGTASLQDTLNEVLQSLDSGNQTLTHLRYLWMTLILTLVVEPTLQYYQPANLLPKYTTELIYFRLRNLITNEINICGNDNINVLIGDGLIKVIGEKRQLFTDKEIASFQILDEALDVFDHAIRVLDYEEASESILEILDDCLEGYAIFPGSYGRRDLFNWWLLDVVPASLNLLPPKSFYVVESLENQEEIKLNQTHLLEHISSEIWGMICSTIV